MLFKIVCPEKVVDNGFVEKFQCTGPIGDVGSAVLESLSLQIYIQYACSGAMNLEKRRNNADSHNLKKQAILLLFAFFQSRIFTNVYSTVESQRTLRDDKISI